MDATRQWRIDRNPSLTNNGMHHSGGRARNPAKASVGAANVRHQPGIAGNRGGAHQANPEARVADKFRQIKQDMACTMVFIFFVRRKGGDGQEFLLAYPHEGSKTT